MVKWILVLAAIVALFIIFRLKPEKTSYQTYQNSEYGFSIEYPQAWEIKTTTQVFEKGDIVAFRKTGLTQKPNTELTDGAQVAISKPLEISPDLPTGTKLSLGNRTFEKIDNCSNLGCFIYYYTRVGNSMFGIAVFAQGENKMVYDNAVVYMLKSLKFAGDEAVTKVHNLPEVINYLREVPNGLVELNGSDDNNYLIQVYETKDGHTATFNWYQVNKKTGEISIND